MSEQIVLMRHGESDANFRGSHERGLVQGPDSVLTERGREQVARSANYLGQLITARVIEVPDVIYASDYPRAQQTALIVQERLKHIVGVYRQIVTDTALREKREPLALENRTAREIESDPMLSVVKRMANTHDFKETYHEQNGVRLENYQTWPEVIALTRLALSRITGRFVAPLIVSHAGTLGALQMHIEHDMAAEIVMEETMVSSEHAITPQEMFNRYAFKFGNAQGMAFKRSDIGWQMVKSWSVSE